MTLRRLACCGLLLAATSLALLPAQEAERAPLPAPKIRKAAAARIDTAFAERLATEDPEEREELALELFAMTAEGRVEGAERFALLERSASLAASAGRLSLLEDVVSELDARFSDLPLNYRGGLLKAADRGLSKEADRTPLVVAWLRLADRARGADDWKSATQSVERGLAVARSMKDRALIARCQEKKRALRALRSLVKARDAAPRRFADDPADPEVRGAYGEYLCLARGRWTEGLAFVLEGPEEARLVALARKEKALADSEPADRAATAMRALAAQYFESARREKKRLASAALYDRARHHFLAARSGLGALEVAEVDAKLKQIPSWVDDWRETPRFSTAPWRLFAIEDRAKLEREGPYFTLELSKENNIWAGLRGTAPFYVRRIEGQRDEIVVAYRIQSTGLPDKSQFGVCVWDGKGHAMYCGPQKDTDNGAEPSIRCLGSTPESPTFAGPAKVDHGRTGQLRVIWEAGTIRFAWRARARDGWTPIQTVKTQAAMIHIGVLGKQWGQESLRVAFRVL